MDIGLHKVKLNVSNNNRRWNGIPYAYYEIHPQDRPLKEFANYSKPSFVGSIYVTRGKLLGDMVTNVPGTVLFQSHRTRAVSCRRV